MINPWLIANYSCKCWAIRHCFMQPNDSVCSSYVPLIITWHTSGSPLHTRNNFGHNYKRGCCRMECDTLIISDSHHLASALTGLVILAAVTGASDWFIIAGSARLCLIAIILLHLYMRLLSAAHRVSCNTAIKGEEAEGGVQFHGKFSFTKELFTELQTAK